MEFAILAPVLMLILLLAVDFGRLFFTYVAVNNAAREGAAYASAHAADGAADATFSETAYKIGIRDAGLREANAQGQGGEGELTISDPTCFPEVDCHAASLFAGGTGNRVTVTASQPFTFLTPFVTDVVGGQLDLIASATAPILNPIDIALIPDPDPGPGSDCPAVSFEWSLPDPADDPLTVEFTDTTIGGSNDRSWDYGDSTPPSPQADAVHTYTYGSAGTYAVTLTVDSCLSAPQNVAIDDGSGGGPPPDPTCEVPNFIGAYWENVGGIPATQVWVAEGFTGELTDKSNKKEILSQTLAAGSDVSCSSSMTVSFKDEDQ